MLGYTPLPSRPLCASRAASAPRAGYGLWVKPSLPALAFVLFATGCAHRGGSPAALGPRRDTVPLYRPFPDADKVYVEADVGDGEKRIFMVDTGASVSVITPEVAAAVGLEVTDRGEQLIGLGGRTSWRRATIPRLEIGAFELPDVEVAVGVPGVPTTAGLAPVAGILGNNVWGRFQVLVDYHADELILGRPGALEVPASATPMTFNGQHVSTTVTLQVGPEDATLTKELVLEIDTGARGLVVSGSTGAGLEGVVTEGEEVILGVGAGDDVPTANFIRMTRRAPVSHVSLGGADVARDLELTWINYEQGADRVGPPEMRGLVGYEVLADQRVLFDYPGGRIGLMPGEGPVRRHDLHERMLAELRGRRDLESLRLKATLLAVLGREAEADEVIAAVLERAPGDPEATVLRARILRAQGDAAAAMTALSALTPGELVEQGEIVSVVNGRWLAGDAAGALALAEEAVAVRSEDSAAWVALSDARRVAGDLVGARTALRQANRLDELPEGHLLRRAWLASREGDALAAITFARRQIDRAPTWGATFWLYGLVATSAEDRALLARDLERALGRLHPGDRPLDFAALAWRLMGDAERARALAAEGRARDCERVDGESRANCEAWYLAMSGEELDRARQRIDEALTAAPGRSEFLDTRATVYEAMGELDAARAAAWQAAALSPDDVYLLWQAERLDAALARGARP